MKLGLISDTHGYIDDRILARLEECDEVWHAGDIGDPSVLNKLSKIADVYGVYGNIDGTRIRSQFPEYLFRNVNGVKILMIHIAGSTGRYNPRTRELIQLHQPDVLICGHSHILKVKRDDRFKLLYINPGAAGRYGFHKVRTICTMEINEGRPENFQVIELGPKSAQSVDRPD